MPLVLAGPCAAQPPPGRLIDRVVAVVGREAILQSDLNLRLEQAVQAGASLSDSLVCGELEALLLEKLMLEQAKVDSVEVEEAQVEAELDRRIDYFARQIGSRQKLEEFYGKNIAEIKNDFRQQVRDQLLVQRMQQRITADVRVTPRDVQRFFARIPADSIPYINAEVEWAQLLRIPKPSDEEERRVRRKLEEHRERVANGSTDFCVIAQLYSEDPGSKNDCGELGLVPTGVMVPEFDAVAMSLREGAVSQVFRTQYGYHFMQLLERRGDQYNARHVLLRPQVGSADLAAAKRLLDSLAVRIRSGELSFGDAASQWSDDEDSRGTNGLMIEPNSNGSRWDIGALDQQTFFVLDKLRPGEVSEPQLIVLPDGSKAYRLLQLLSRTDPHRANLKDDYRLLQQACEGELRAQAMDRWVRDRVGGTYVRMDADYAGCPFEHRWLAPVEDGR